MKLVTLDEPSKRTLKSSPSLRARIGRVNQIQRLKRDRTPLKDADKERRKVLQGQRQRGGLFLMLYIVQSLED
jgi:hypothetical protein